MKPTAECELSTDGTQLVVARCPLCGKTHVHGAGNSDLVPGNFSAKEDPRARGGKTRHARIPRPGAPGGALHQGRHRVCSEVGRSPRPTTGLQWGRDLGRKGRRSALSPLPHENA